MFCLHFPTLYSIPRNVPRPRYISEADIARYSDFLKRDDQILAMRLQHEERLDQRKKAAVDLDRARAQNGQDGVYPDVDQDLDVDVTMDDVGGESYGSKTIVIHIGSQNLRLGLATDALPKTVPMVIARKSDHSESEVSEPKPKRQKMDEDSSSEDWFGEDVCKSSLSVAIVSNDA